MERKKKVLLPRRERQSEIILTAHSMYAQRKYSFTNAKMAKSMGLSVSSWLKRILEDLVAEGWLERTEKIHRRKTSEDGSVWEIKKHLYHLTDYALNQLAIL